MYKIEIGDIEFGKEYVYEKDNHIIRIVTNKTMGDMLEFYNFHIYLNGVKIYHSNPNPIATMVFDELMIQIKKIIDYYQMDSLDRIFK